MITCLFVCSYSTFRMAIGNLYKGQRYKRLGCAISQCLVNSFQKRRKQWILQVPDDVCGVSVNFLLVKLVALIMSTSQSGIVQSSIRR